MTDGEQTIIAVQIGKLEAKLENTDTKLDAIHASLKEDIGKVEAQTRAHNGRMTRLEERVAMLKGGLIVISCGLPFLLYALQKLTGG